MGVTVRVNLAGAKQKLSKANFDRGTYAMLNQMMPDMNRFVPMKRSTLRQTVHIGSDRMSIVWRTKYAKAQFYGTNGKVTFRKYSTPGTGKRWDLKSKTIYIKSWKLAFIRGSGL